MSGKGTNFVLKTCRESTFLVYWKHMGGTFSIIL